MSVIISKNSLSCGPGRAAIGGFHNARPAAGDDVIAVFGKHETELSRLLIRRRFRLDSRRTEKGDRFLDVGQKIKSVNELRYYLANPPPHRFPKILYRLSGGQF